MELIYLVSTNITLFHFKQPSSDYELSYLDSYRLVLWDLLRSSDLVILSFSHWKILTIFLSQFLLMFLQSQIISFACNNDSFSLNQGKHRQTTNRCERVLEALEITYSFKTRESIISHLTLLSRHLLIVFSTKVNMVLLFSLTVLRYCLLHLIRQLFQLKSFLRMITLILMTNVSIHQNFILELIWNYMISF